MARPEGWALTLLAVIVLILMWVKWHWPSPATPPAHPEPSAGTQSPGFQALLDQARFPRVFVKLSGYYYFSGSLYPYADCHDLVHAVYDCLGPERLLWGSTRC